MLVTSALNTDYCVVSYDYETQDGDFIEKLNGNIVADGCYIACSHLIVTWTKLSSMELLKLILQFLHLQTHLNKIY